MYGNWKCKYFVIDSDSQRYCNWMLIGIEIIRNQYLNEFVSLLTRQISYSRIENSRLPDQLEVGEMGNEAWHLSLDRKCN